MPSFLLALLLVAPQDLASIEQTLRTGTDREKASALYDAAKKLGSEEALRLLPPFFDAPNPYLSDRAIAAFSETKNGAGFLAVAKDALESPKPRIRHGALEALARTRLAVPADLPAGALADGDAEGRFLALHVLIAHPPAKGPAALDKLASPQEKDPKIRATALWAWGAIAAGRAAGDGAPSPLAAASKDKDPTIRIGALLGLEAAKAAPTAAIEALADPDKRVRLAALAWICRARPAGAGAVLAANLGKETGRVREATLEALDAIRKAAVPVPASADVDTKVEFPKYHELAVRSDRVAFLVDVSGSMRERSQGSGETSAGGEGKSKIETAADELRRAVAALPKGTRVSVVVFSGEPLRYHEGSKANSNEAVEASAALADRLRKFVVSIGAKNSTNISDALDLVIDDPDVDTIYLLTDGAPSAGKRMLGSRIVEWAQRMVALSRTRIDAVALGASNKDFDFLRKLAEATGGTAVRR
jgi:HEAT repeat protein